MYYQVSHTQIHKYKYTNTQIQHITKCQKDPTCDIFLKRGFSESSIYHLCVASSSSAHHQCIISLSSAHHQCIIALCSVYCCLVMQQIQLNIFEETKLLIKSAAAQWHCQEAPRGQPSNRPIWTKTSPIMLNFLITWPKHI